MAPSIKVFTAEQLLKTLGKFFSNLIEERRTCPFLSYILSKASLKGIRIFFDAPNEVTPSFTRMFAKLCLR
ncbi:MAG: hypothetical protein QXK52_07365 [Candidatus Bathyarchaeia archaeon]